MQLMVIQDSDRTKIGSIAAHVGMELANGLKIVKVNEKSVIARSAVPEAIALASLRSITNITEPTLTGLDSTSKVNSSIKSDKSRDIDWRIKPDKKSSSKTVPLLLTLFHHSRQKKIGKACV